MTATLADPIRAALKAGWTVDHPDRPVAVVHCPDGTTVRVYTTSGAEHLDKAMQRLRRHGLDEALAVAEANRGRTAERVSVRAEQERRERAEAEREQARQKAANDAALRRATAGSGYFLEPDTVSILEIMAPHPAPKVFRVLVTPDMARAMLTANTHNRKPRASDITHYGSAMNEGAWLLTHQPIAFDINGVLLDGQQRLGAIIESGKPADVFIMVGMPPESFDVVDTHRKRTSADTLYVLGETQVHRLAAVCRMVHIYDTDQQGDWRNRVSNHTIASVLAANPQIRQAISRAYPVSRATRGNFTAISAGVYLLWRAMSPEHPRVVEFLDGMETGANMDVSDPRMRLRNSTQQAIDRRVTRDSRRQLALWLKAWRAFALDKKVDLIGWRKDERFPSVLVVQPGE